MKLFPKIRFALKVSKTFVHENPEKKDYVSQVSDDVLRVHLTSYLDKKSLGMFAQTSKRNKELSQPMLARVRAKYPFKPKQKNSDRTYASNREWFADRFLTSSIFLNMIKVPSECMIYLGAFAGMFIGFGLGAVFSGGIAAVAGIFVGALGGAGLGYFVVGPLIGALICGLYASVMAVPYLACVTLDVVDSLGAKLISLYTKLKAKSPSSSVEKLHPSQNKPKKNEDEKQERVTKFTLLNYLQDKLQPSGLFPKAKNYVEESAPLIGADFKPR